jgi:hypothetical protein
MRDIARAHGASMVSDADHRTIEAAARIVLGLPEGVPADLAPCAPDALARAMSDDASDAAQAVRMLAVMSLTGGRIDPDKIALVQQYADAVSVHESYVRVLAEAAAGDIAAASACMIRRNAESFGRLDLASADLDSADLDSADPASADLDRDDGDPVAAFLPCRGGHDDAALTARYEALADLRADTFGRAFWEHFKSNGFAFPGDPNGLAEGFTTPHDTSDVLSSFTTSAPGELLVSTFIGAMHPDHPMSAEVLPVRSPGTSASPLTRSPAAGAAPSNPASSGPHGTAARLPLSTCSTPAGTSGPRPNGRSRNCGANTAYAPLTQPCWHEPGGCMRRKAWKQSWPGCRIAPSAFVENVSGSRLSCP